MQAFIKISLISILVAFSACTGNEKKWKFKRQEK